MPYSPDTLDRGCAPVQLLETKQGQTGFKGCLTGLKVCQSRINLDQNWSNWIMVGLCEVKVGLTGVQKEQTGLKICLTRVKIESN